MSSSIQESSHSMLFFFRNAPSSTQGDSIVAGNERSPPLEWNALDGTRVAGNSPVHGCSQDLFADHHPERSFDKGPAGSEPAHADPGTTRRSEAHRQPPGSGRATVPFSGGKAAPG